MAEVLIGDIKHDGEVFEAGSPASKLPKAVRERARQNGFLIPGPKATSKKAKAEEEAAEAEDAESDEVEPGTEE